MFQRSVAYLLIGLSAAAGKTSSVYALCYCILSLILLKKIPYLIEIISTGPFSCITHFWVLERPFVIYRKY